jgi:hypothetical protein
LAVANYVDNTISIFLQNGTITLSPPSLDFGGRLVGSRTATRRVLLKNVGTSTLKISKIALAGADPNDFLERNDCPSSLPPRGHCTIRVSFKPTQVGPRSASVAVTDNAPDSPQSVPLSGIGLTSGPNATLFPTSLNFGNVVVGQNSPPQPTTLGNYGTKTLHITSIKITGTDPQDFSETNNCPKYLRSQKACTVSVTFSPQNVGTFNADVSVYDNAPGSPQQVSLSGTGQPSCSGSCYRSRCPTGCTCYRGAACIPASSAVVEEDASRLTCRRTDPFTDLR